MRMTHCLDQIHIPIKLHLHIPNGYRIMGCTRTKITQNKQKTQNNKNKQSYGHNSQP